MRTWFFYSTPDSTQPSPYFFRVPKMLRHLSRSGILRFRLWQGRHDAPVPLDDGPEPVNYKAMELPNTVSGIAEQERWVKEQLAKAHAIDETFFRTRILGEFIGNEPIE